MAYNYPGNIREMENIIYGIWAENERDINQLQLPKRLLNPNKANSLKLKDVVNNHVRKVYDSMGGNISKTAEILGVQQGTVRGKLVTKRRQP
jgi:transcriptional regulator of acetoin/glycerol metabolism